MLGRHRPFSPHHGGCCCLVLLVPRHFLCVLRAYFTLHVGIISYCCRRCRHHTLHWLSHFHLIHDFQRAYQDLLLQGSPSPIIAMGTHRCRRLHHGGVPIIADCATTRHYPMQHSTQFFLIRHPSNQLFYHSLHNKAVLRGLISRRRIFLFCTIFLIP